MDDSMKIDILREVLNIGIGDAADSLSKIINAPVKISIPKIELIKIDDIPDFIEEKIKSTGVFVSQDFSGSIEGKVILAYSRQSANSLLVTVVKERRYGNNFSKSDISILEEIGNLIMVSCISTIVDVIETDVCFSLPVVSTNLAVEYFKLLSQRMQEYEHCIVATNRMEISDIVFESLIYILLSVSDLENMVETLYKKMKVK